MTPRIIAHRGYSVLAPENTLAGLEAAIAAGAEAIEFDISTAACGTPILFHDVHLGRTTNGVGPVRRRTAEQMRALDAGSWFSNEFVGERVPLLREALDCLAGRVEHIYAEIKGYREMEDVDRMIAIAEATGTVDSITAISLDWVTIDRVRSQSPHVKVGLIVEKAERFEEAFRRATTHGQSLLALEAGMTLENPPFVQRARDAGLDVGVWTVDDTEMADRLLDLGVQAFTTNQVERLQDWASTKAG